MPQLITQHLKIVEASLVKIFSGARIIGIKSVSTEMSFSGVLERIIFKIFLFSANHGGVRHLPLV